MKQENYKWVTIEEVRKQHKLLAILMHLGFAITCLLSLISLTTYTFILVYFTTIPVFIIANLSSTIQYYHVKHVYIKMLNSNLDKIKVPK